MDAALSRTQGNAAARTAGNTAAPPSLPPAQQRKKQRKKRRLNLLSLPFQILRRILNALPVESQKALLLTCRLLFSVAASRLFESAASCCGLSVPIKCSNFMVIPFGNRAPLGVWRHIRECNLTFHHKVRQRDVRLLLQKLRIMTRLRKLTLEIRLKDLYESEGALQAPKQLIHALSKVAFSQHSSLRALRISLNDDAIPIELARNVLFSRSSKLRRGSFSTITSLRVTCCDIVTQQIPFEIGKVFPNLSRLSLWGVDLSCTNLSNLRFLQKLKIVCCFGVLQHHCVQITSGAAARTLEKLEFCMESQGPFFGGPSENGNLTVTLDPDWTALQQLQELVLFLNEDWRVATNQIKKLAAEGSSRLRTIRLEMSLNSQVHMAAPLLSSARLLRLESLLLIVRHEHDLYITKEDFDEAHGIMMKAPANFDMSELVLHPYLKWLIE